MFQDCFTSVALSTHCGYSREQALIGAEARLAARHEPARGMVLRRPCFGEYSVQYKKFWSFFVAGCFVFI